MFVLLLKPFDTWLLLFRIKSEPGVALKSIVYEKTCDVFSLLKMKKQLYHEFIFKFVQYFIGVISSKVLSKASSSEKM